MTYTILTPHLYALWYCQNFLMSILSTHIQITPKSNTVIIMDY